MALHSLSSLDGRYQKDVAPLAGYFSEFAYLRSRTRIELDFLQGLSKIGICQPPGISLDSFTDEDALKIQEYEKTTRHDVKAIEYYLREKLPAEVHPFIHFGLTSEDVNNIAQALSLRDSRDFVLLPALDGLLHSLLGFAKTHRALPMLARTHGQPAVPTTFGKEIAVYVARLLKCREELASHSFETKLTGATGNFNALQAAAPQVDWLSFSTDFLKNLGLQPNLVTTQILPYDNWLRYFQALQLTNSVLTDFSQDMWRYISDGYLKQKAVAGEIGSSTMPQKINPIDFENAEGNLGLANAMFGHYVQKLSVSRLQRDLSDSTVRRTFGVALGHTLLAWINLSKGMARIAPDEERLNAEMNAHWEVLSEGAQTILRKAGKSDAYESLLLQTRGKPMDGTLFKSWVDALTIDRNTRESLNRLSPENYIGLAIQITDTVIASASKTISQ